jgi:hypothetical protein
MKNNVGLYTVHTMFVCVHNFTLINYLVHRDVLELYRSGPTRGKGLETRLTTNLYDQKLNGGSSAFT